MTYEQYWKQQEKIEKQKQIRMLRPLNIYVEAYNEIISNNMQWIADLNREVGILRKIKEAFPDNTELQQRANFFITLNSYEIEDKLMRSINNAREAIEGFKGI